MRLPQGRKANKAVLALLICEFAGVVAALALFGIAAPNTYRTALWKDGGLNGFNSDPKQIVYAFANHRPVPKTPMVWSQFITNWNVAVSVTVMFALLIKAILHVMHLFHPILSLALHTILTAMWIVSIYGQAGPDRSDPKHPSSTPWYLTKSCDVARVSRNVHYCKMAKASFAVSVIMLAITLSYILVAIYSLIPKRKAGHRRDASNSSDVSMTGASPDSYISNDKSWELHDVPRTPAAHPPVTPRTQAFNTLTSNR
ncbi:MAG: hypothetical protein M1816_001465 [Peltula sp. TS41687]|nr:MAG: hypothetical protein M1816_001465 [Peltula sp. TS41687]